LSIGIAVRLIEVSAELIIFDAINDDDRNIGQQESFRFCMIEIVVAAIQRRRIVGVEASFVAVIVTKRKEGCIIPSA
jgi:hypothetical protein